MGEVIGVHVRESEAQEALTEAILVTLECYAVKEGLSVADGVLALASATRHVLCEPFDDDAAEIAVARWEHRLRQNVPMLDQAASQADSYTDLLGYLATWLGSEAMSAVRASRDGCRCPNCKGS